jgi:signal transduction histidine kinase
VSRIELEVDARTRDPQYVAPMRVRAVLDRFADGAIALAFTVWTQLDLWKHAPATMHVVGGRVVFAVLLLLVTLPLAVRRRAPAATMLTAAGALVLAATLVTHSRGIPVEVFLAMLLAFYSVGAHCEDRRAPLVGAVALAAIAVVDLVRPGFFNSSGGSRPGAWLAFAIAWLVGRDLRRRRQRVADLEDRATRLEHDREEKAQRAVAEERGRIARELHDVIAHAVSVIVVQAQAGPHLLDEPKRVRGVFGSIESSGRDALAELRRVLGILRSEDQQLAIGPQPGLDSLQSLVDQVRASGLPVELRVEGEPFHLPAGIDLSAYRIVQEALTNVVKHAGNASAQVVIRYGPRALELDIVDDGLGGTPSVNGAGHGLIGMRERVALYGGTLETGARNGGGYAVRARLPLGDAP